MTPGPRRRRRRRGSRRPAPRSAPRRRISARCGPASPRDWIVSPIDGDRLRTPGECGRSGRRGRRKPAPFPHRGQPRPEPHRHRTLRARWPVSAGDSRCEFTTDAIPGRTFQGDGDVHQSGGQRSGPLGPGHRGGEQRARGSSRAGSSFKGRIVTGRRDGVILAPREALSGWDVVGKKAKLFIVDGDRAKSPGGADGARDGGGGGDRLGSRSPARPTSSGAPSTSRRATSSSSPGNRGAEP